MLTVGVLYCATLAATFVQRCHVTGVSSEPVVGFICGALLAPGVLAMIVGVAR